ncbi:MAG: hypothetical protein IH840_02155 [Candidatus Heimdallarchaeota archaeon]|nr:hypothetical protein [Candidatus Heimdallarchaeota archaeon]
MNKELETDYVDPYLLERYIRRSFDEQLEHDNSMDRLISAESSLNSLIIYVNETIEKVQLSEN